MKKPQVSSESGLRALQDHVMDRALAARARYGESVGPDTIAALLDDREVVRYPTVIEFGESGLEPGEFAHAEPVGDTPADGFRLWVHPRFRDREELPLLVAYHIVRINYGEIVTHEEAELFGATLLGLDVDRYYETLCALADELDRDDRP